MIPLDELRAHADAVPDTIAVTDGRTAMTWREFADAVTTARAYFTGRLDPDGDHRAVLAVEDSVAAVVAATALGSLGVPWAGIPPDQAAERTREQLRAVEPTVLVLDGALPGVDAPTGAMPAMLADLTHPGAVRPGNRGWPTRPYSSLGFTSGTTGTPKLFVRRTPPERQRVDMLRDRFGFGRGDGFVLASSLALASGRTWAAAVLRRGGTLHLAPGGAAEAAAAVSAWRASGTFLVPSAVDGLLAAGAEIPLDSLRFVLTGGRQVSPHTIRETERRLGAVLHVYYATSETGINTLAGPADLAAHPYSAGRALPGVDVRAVDPDTYEALPDGRPGRLAVASPLGDDAAIARPGPTAELAGRRYVVTDDFGRVDALGFVYITARAAPEADLGRIDVVRLEGEFRELPHVRDACVLAVAGSDGPVAAVLAATDPAAWPAAERGARAVLERFGVGGRVEHVGSVPYTRAGKVDTPALRRELGL